MPRRLAGPRLLAKTRKIALNRKVIKIHSDGKVKAILDTGILLAALIAKKNKHFDGAPYQIIEAYKNDVFHISMSAEILKEYSRVTL